MQYLEPADTIYFEFWVNQHILMDDLVKQSDF